MDACHLPDPDAVIVSLNAQRWTVWLVMAALIVLIIYTCSFIDRDPGPPPRGRR